MSDAAPSSLANRLAGEKSPYLLQHARNPVAWYPWGEEAFARARAEQKPIFLSIGYSTCHWCHVMAHESFENPSIADALNAHFVPVKVDREERPDVDRVYMAYVQAATGHGGWPMSVWLTPDLKPFYGGTYFPPEDRWGRPGLATLLHTLAKAWKNEPGKLAARGERFVEAFRQHAASPGPGPRGDDLAAAGVTAFEQCFQFLYETFDTAQGGFGGAPKFPRAAAFNFLFRCAAVQGAASEVGREAVRMAGLTLRRMAEGGLHDHVGGGFHRYAVDVEWFVPHFEKMLYDQAQLAVCYLEARQATGDERHGWVARGIFDYVLRDLANPAGGFYSAEDADSEEVGSEEQGAGSRGKAEGAFYVWSRKEIETVLAADAELFCAHYGVRDGGNVPEARDPHGEFRGRNILMQRQSLAATARQFDIDPQAASDGLLACLQKLQGARVRRPRPHLDDKVLTAWNGLMISALARGHQILGGGPVAGADPGETAYGGREAAALPTVASYLASAVRAAEFIRRELHDETHGVLYRSWRKERSGIEGFAEDYACLIQGLLDLYEASFEIRWLKWAERLQAIMDEKFWDGEAGGYFNSRAGDPAILVRLKEDYDGAEPAPSSVAAMNLVRFSWMLGTGDAASPSRTSGRGGGAAGPIGAYRERALRCLEAFRGQWGRTPHAMPQMLCAIELAMGPPRTVVLAGDPQADDFRALAPVPHERPGPRRALLAADGKEAQQWLSQRMPYLAEIKPLKGRATAYVCERFACRQPVTEPAELRRLLE